MFDANAPHQNSANDRWRSGASDAGSLTPAAFHTRAPGPALGSATIGPVNRLVRVVVPMGALLLGAALLGAGCGDDTRDRVDAAADKARCMADGATATFGGEVVDAVREAGTDVVALGDIASDKGGELRAALDDCVDVQRSLTDALVDAGLSDEKATCVATRALDDEQIIGPLLVTMVFGDPGVATAVGIAVKAGGPCLTAADIDRVLPG
jgi:hypothetical protein